MTEALGREERHICIMRFDRTRRRFRLLSVHPERTVDVVRENTGFDFDLPAKVAETPAPDAETLALLRSEIGHEVAEACPAFASRVFGIAA
jgi:glutaconate CoA-transferase subunit B